MPHSGILVLSQSPHSTGKIYVIGDVHGEIRAFEAVINTLTPDDTLIIVGDLIDRGQGGLGQTSSQLILDKLLQLHNAAAGTAPKVMVIKGNHEVDFLKLMTLLDTPTATKAEDEIVGLALTVIANGGIWMFKDIDDEQTRDLHLWGMHLGCQSSEYRPQAALFLHEFIRSKLLKNASTKSNYLHSNISEYIKYIESLPYIIKIDDAANPAWVVHADLPFTDEQLQTIIDNNLKLPPVIIATLTNTRPQYFSKNRYGNNSAVRVYCGHNIIDDEPAKKDFPALPVRTASNHVNLDGGAYFTGAFLMVNHTDNTVKLVGDNSHPEVPFLSAAVCSIQKHFDDKPYTSAISTSAITTSEGQLLATQSIFASKPEAVSSHATANMSKTAKRPKEDMEGEIVESKDDVERIDAKTQIK